MTRKLKFIFLFSGIFFFALAMQVSYSLWPINPEQNSLNLSFTDIYGKTHSWNEYSEQITIVFFWASWCSVCQHEIASLNQLLETQSQNYRVLGINVDENKDDLLGFMQMHQITFPIIHDENRELTEKFQVEELPRSFVFQYGNLVKETTGELEFLHHGHTH